MHEIVVSKILLTEFRQCNNMGNIDLNDLENLEIVTENTGEPNMSLVLRLKNGKDQKFNFGQGMLSSPHVSTVRMRMTFPKGKGFWERFEGKIPLQINVNNPSLINVQLGY